eukprot:3071353-Pleurochrysis_carterae.AAC.1
MGATFARETEEGDARTGKEREGARAGKTERRKVASECGARGKRGERASLGAAHLEERGERVDAPDKLRADALGRPAEGEEDVAVRRHGASTWGRGRALLRGKTACYGDAGTSC